MGLCYRRPGYVCVFSHQLLNVWTNLYEISAAYFTNPSRQSVCICVPPIVARQKLGRHVSVATDTRNNRRNIGDVVFCCPCQTEGESVGLSVYPLMVTRQRLSKHILATTKYWWKRRFLSGACCIKRK